MVSIQNTKAASIDGATQSVGPNGTVENLPVTQEPDTTAKICSSSETNPTLLRHASIAKALAACAIKEGRPLEDHEIITAIHSSSEQEPDISIPISKKQGFIFRWLDKVDTFFALFEKEPKVDVQKLVKAAQEYLGIKDEDMPKVVDNFDALPSIAKVNGALYDPSTGSLHILPTGFDIFKSIFSLAGFRKKSMERLPDSLKNFFGNLYRIGNESDNRVCHELIHHRQSLPIRKLTKDEAKEVIKDFVAQSEGEANDLIVSIYLSKFPQFQQIREHSVQEHELEKSKESLLNLLNLGRANNPVSQLCSAGKRKYIANQLEVEARREAAAFCVKDAVEVIKRHSQGISVNSEKLERALEQVRSYQTEELLNETLLEIEELKAKQALPEEIDRLEQKLKDLVSKSPMNTTNIFLQEEYRIARQESKKPGPIKMAIAKLATKWAVRNYQA